MSAKPTPIFSGRFRPFLNEIGTGLRLEKSPVTKQECSLEERDLIVWLISKNSELWTDLLGNEFCQKMKAAPSDDEDVLRGFKSYMIQDYFYVANLIKLEESYVSNAETAEDLGVALEGLLDAVKYTGGFFAMLTTEEPCGLGIPSEDILGAELSQVLKDYIDLINCIAKKGDRILSEVVVIACYQSYCTISADLYKYSADKDTLWYKFWAEANYGYAASCLRQQNFFIDNYEHWIDRKDEIAELFVKVCEAEIGLWNEALENS